MKRYERICSLLLAMLLLLGALAACKDQPTPEQGSTEDTTTTEAQTQLPERDPITYTFEDGILDEVVDDKPIEEKPDEHYEYVQDFSAAIGGNDPDWYLNEMADISDGNLTAYNNQHPYLALKKKAKADLVTLCVDLQANRPGAIPNDSAYIALRLPAYDNQFAAVGQNGIWLAFQCGKVGIINTWPSITFFDCGVDFTKTQQVIVEDNQKDNVISVYVQENDTKELVFKVEIRDNKNVTVTDKNGAPKIASKFGYDIPASGFMALWAHQDNGGVVFDNLKVNWTVPGNPTMTKTSSYAQDFNASIAGDEHWSHNATAVFEDGMVVGTNEHCYLDMTRRVRADKVYVELDMLADRKGTVDNVASYVGLRVTERDQFRATGPDGIWLAFHDNKIGLITGWPGTKMYVSEFSFASMRHVLIEDDTVNNVITVYIKEGGESQLVCRFVIQNEHDVKVYDNKGNQKITHTLGHDLNRDGFICFWAPAGNMGKSKRNPDSRRLIVSSWNPTLIEKMALPPCHTLFQFYVIDNKLSCQLYQRSADAFLGVPFNIASYALLTMMVAQVCNLELGDFVHTVGDAHIYSNHLEQVNRQLAREPRSLPKMNINKEVKNIEDFKFEDFELTNYNPHKGIKAEVAV